MPANLVTTNDPEIPWAWVWPWAGGIQLSVAVWWLLQNWDARDSLTPAHFRIVLPPPSPGPPGLRGRFPGPDTPVTPCPLARPPLSEQGCIFFI